MSSNKFEKQVQENLGELQFTPSDAVWQNVEKELRKEKKRRRWLLLPILLLCIVAGGYLIYDSSDNTVSRIQKNTPISVPATPSLKEEAVAQNKEVVTPNKQDRNSFSEEDKTDNKVIDKEIALNGSQLNGKASVEPVSNNKANRLMSTDTYNKQNISAILADKKDKNNSKKVKWRNNDPVTLIHQPDKQRKINKVETRADIVTDEGGEVLIKNKNKADEIASVTDDVTLPLQKEIVAKDTDKLTDLNDALTNKDTAQKRYKIDTMTKNVPVVTKSAKQETKKSKWKWYGDVAVGLSNLNTSFAPLGALGISEENKSADALPVFNSGGTPVAAQGSQSAPSISKPGFSFEAGITAERKISNRSSVSIGLQYAYYSNVGIAGQVADTAIINAGLQNLNIASNRAAVYVSGPATKNGNQYHFLQIPVSFTTLVGNSKRLPWYWSTGFSLNYLFASDALVYNSTAKVYNKNSELFQPIQFGWHTGIEVELFSKKHHPLRLGPQFNFNISKLIKNSGLQNQLILNSGNTDQNQRFTYAGIKASILLNKK